MKRILVPALAAAFVVSCSSKSSSTPANGQNEEPLTTTSLPVGDPNCPASPLRLVPP